MLDPAVEREMCSLNLSTRTLMNRRLDRLGDTKVLQGRRASARLWAYVVEPE